MAVLTDVSSAKSGVPITPGTPFLPCRAVYVGTAGTVNVRWQSGATCPMPNAAAGEHPWSITEVIASGTTASDLVALY